MSRDIEHRPGLVFFVMGAEERTALAGRTDEAAGVLLDHLRPVRGRRWSAAHPRLGEPKARQDDGLLKETEASQQRKHRLMPGIPALAVVAAALLAWRRTENQEADQLAGETAGFRLERRAADGRGGEAVCFVRATLHASDYPGLA